MARDIYTRLSTLEQRRKGTDRLSGMTFDSMNEVLSKSLQAEAWQSREDSKPYTKYALGAMQEVGPDYTRISIETAQRVGRQLDQGLTTAGHSVDFRLQGSVPLNIHIRGISDVDLLNLDTSFLTYSRAGMRSQLGFYTSPSSQTSVGVLTAIRRTAEGVLKDKFPSATVDCSGRKSIKIFGGSLARHVDVVPSHWHDNDTYQSSGHEHDRTVTILDKSVPTTIDNLPFMHIKLVNEQDAIAGGGLKKAIRLCKNVRSDADSDIALPSFDLASIMFHASLPALSSGAYNELNILAETQRHLDALWQNKDHAKKLRVPDGSRFIFNTEAKLNALLLLSCEMDALARDVAKEQSPWLGRLEKPSFQETRTALSQARV